MTPWMIIKYLLGSREAIERLYGDRRTLPLGALLVLSAGIAREYDAQDLVHEPWHLVGPFGASIVTSLALYALFALLCRAKSVELPWRAYWAFLGLYWLTAPLAWAYGVPYERFMSPVGAVGANAWTLVGVAIWRVALISRVISVLLRCAYLPVLLWTFWLADGAIFVANLLMPAPVFDFMGGLHLAPEDRLRASLSFATGFYSFFGFFLLLIPAAVSGKWFRPHTPEATISSEPVGGGFVPALLAGAACVALWIPALMWAQPEQILRSRVESCFYSGRTREALDLMSAHERGDFPPQWSPPPRSGWPGKRLPFRPIREAIEAKPVARWVEQEFVYRARRIVCSWPLGYTEPNSPWTATFDDSFNSRIRSPDLVQFLLRHDPEVDQATRERVEAALTRLGGAAGAPHFDPDL